MNHPTEVPHYTLQALAAEVSRLRYDALTDFVTHLSMEINKASEADVTRGRPLLAQALARAAQRIADSTEDLYTAWRISKPHELGPEKLPDPGRLV